MELCVRYACLCYLVREEVSGNELADVRHISEITAVPKAFSGPKLRMKAVCHTLHYNSPHKPKCSLPQGGPAVTKRGEEMMPESGLGSDLYSAQKWET